MVRGRDDSASPATLSDDETDAPSGVRGAAPPDQLARGTIVGRYTVLSLVGRGGMSEVYGAYDPALDRKVALKVLRHGSGGQEGQQSRLHREARAIAQISHPNVIAVHEVGTFGDRVFIAIEFIEGQTLRAWLAERPRSRGDILAAFAEAARGLAAAHAKGLIHRDFKPHNVLVGHDGVVRVTDFGLARWIDEAAPADPGGGRPPRSLGVDLTKTGQLVGTPLYMAPEQLDGRPMDARTDQFSFCVALYEALYAEHPFSPSGDAETLTAAIRAGQVRAPSARGAVPAWQRRAILRGLAVSPAARWPSMDALVSALTIDPARKRRRWLALGVAGLAVAGAAVAWRSRAQSETALCAARQSDLDGIWGPSGRDRATDARRNAVQAAFMTTGVSTAAEVWNHTAPLLDRYAGEWLRMDRESCEATRVLHQQSMSVLEQRSTCLGERREALRALVDVLATADAGIMPRAVDAVLALPALDLCAAPRSSRASATPGDPAARARVDDIRRRALVARAQHDAGRDAQAIAQAKTLLEEAQAVGYAPLVAELMSLIGSAKAEILDPDAPSVLEEATWLSLDTNRDDLAAQTAARLAGITSDYLQRPADGERWARLSEVLLDRLGDGNERLRAWLLNDRAVVLQESGHLAEALQLAREALALKRKALHPDDPDIAHTLLTEGETLHQLGDDRAALTEIDEAYRLLVAAYGPSAVIVAQALSNRGESLARLGRFEAALDSFQESLSRWQAQVPPDNQFLAYPLTGLGDALLALGRPAEARAPLERAWKIREASEPSVAERGATAFALARVSWQTGDRRRARALAQTARVNYAKRGTLYARQMREIDVWMAGHS